MKKEEDLYAPVKALLEAQGYEVKGEVGAVDVMGLRDGDDDPVLVELKLKFSLSLYQQAITRQAVSDVVYIAVPKPKGRQAKRVMKDNHALCRRLCLGLITVRDDGFAEVHCDPTPYAPRKSKPRKTRLLREFQRLSGDPNKGGARRGGLITGYRDDALKCAAFLAREGASKGADVARATGVAKATTLMRDNHYGWFDKVEKGIYALGAAGEKGLSDWWPNGAAPQENKAD